MVVIAHRLVDDDHALATERGDHVSARRVAGPMAGWILTVEGDVNEHGVVTLAVTSDDDLDGFSAAFVHAVAKHRHFDRDLQLVPA